MERNWFRKLLSKTKEKILDEKDKYPKVQINEGMVVDLENIACGIYSLLEWFLREEEFNRF